MKYLNTLETPDYVAVIFKNDSPNADEEFHYKTTVVFKKGGTTAYNTEYWLKKSDDEALAYIFAALEEGDSE